MSSHGQDSLTPTSRKGSQPGTVGIHSHMQNNVSAIPISSSTYQTFYPHFDSSQPLVYVPVTIEGGRLRPVTGDFSGPQMPLYNGIPLVLGFPYNNLEDSTRNTRDRSNDHVPFGSLMPSTTDTATTATYHHPPLKGQLPLAWFPQQFSSSNFTQATPYGRRVGRRMKPQSRSQGTNFASKNWELSFEQVDSCDSTVNELRRAFSVDGKSPLSFVGSEIEKRRIHRFLVEEHILKVVLVQHLRQFGSSKHFCDEIFHAVFSVFLSTADTKSLVEKCMLCLNKAAASGCSHSTVAILFVEKLDTCMNCLYDHVEKVKRILSAQCMEKKEMSFVDRTSNKWEQQLSNLQYYQGKTLSCLYCRQVLQHIQKKLVELGESLRCFESEAVSRSSKDNLLEIRSFKTLLESFRSKLEQQFSVNWISECESKLIVHIMKLFSASHSIFSHLESLVVSDWEYLKDCKDNVERQASKLESFSNMHKRYAAAKEVAKELSRLIEFKEQRCRTILDERLRLQELNITLAKVLETYGRERLTRELLKEIKSLLKVQRNIDAGLEQLFSISFGEVSDLIRSSLIDSGKKPTRKSTRFSLNLPASVIITETTNTATSTLKSGSNIDIMSPRQRHHRMKSNPDALLHVDRLSPSPGWNQIEKHGLSPDIESISFSQVSNNSMSSFEDESIRMLRNQVSSCDEQMDKGHSSHLSTPQRESSKGLEYAIRTLNLRRLEDQETTLTSVSCHFDGTVRKCYSTASTPKREDIKDLSSLKKTKTTTVASPKARLQPISVPFHHRSQRSQSFDDIIVL